MIEKLASQLGRKDQEPNIQLAQALSQSEDANGIQEIVQGLLGKNKSIAGDCIKVLYELGERKPRLVSPYVDDFIALLRSKNNRLVWGAMTALASIAEVVPDEIFRNLDPVITAFHNGSAITVDNGVLVLAKVCKANPAYEKHLMPVLLEHLRECKPSEVARHAEGMAVCINSENVGAFIAVLEARKGHLTGSPSNRLRRLEGKLLRQFK